LSDLRRVALNPLTEGDSNLCKTKYFNHRTNSLEESLPVEIESNSILIFDGIFLHRKELIDYWDYSLFLDVSRKESLRRCYERDKSGSPDIDFPNNRRYVLGQKIYLNKCNPKSLASVVINNENYDSPFIERYN